VIFAWLLGAAWLALLGHHPPPAPPHHLGARSSGRVRQVAKDLAGGSRSPRMPAPHCGSIRFFSVSKGNFRCQACGGAFGSSIISHGG
jgi:hypothetical protein